MKFEKSSVALFAMLPMVVACTQNGYTSRPGGFELTVGESGQLTVGVEAVSDKIIRVQASPKGIGRQESLITVKQDVHPNYQISETDTAVTLSTAEVSVTVSKRTGIVSFVDKDGNVITSEKDRSFAAVNVENVDGFSFSQEWNSPDDEAFYGLGQHQSDEFNYKGLNEELFQYNTKVSVPFVVSNKNYGILWDNYSLTRYGDSRPYSQLGEVFTLKDKEGKEGALTGTYVPSSQSNTKTLVRREEKIYFEHLDREAHLSKVVNSPDGFPYKDSHVTYEGTLTPKETGTFRFILYYAGYMKVYIDGKEVVQERWRTAWNPNSYKFSVDLESGKEVPIKIDWQPDGYVSYCGLRVHSPRPAKEQGNLALWSEMGDEEDYYLIKGDDMDDVISGYRTYGQVPHNA